MGKVIWAVVCCALALVVKPAEGLSPDACVSLFDPMIDRATESYVHVEISDEKSACFRVPRNVIVKELREFFSLPGLAFDSRDLLDYLNGKTEIRVGINNRVVDRATIDCLASPQPDGIIISDGPPFPPESAAAMKAPLLARGILVEETTTDLPGYRRYSTQGPKDRENHYFLDAGPDAPRSFWCGAYSGPETCVIQGEYDGMKAAIRYRKEDMGRVRPEEALNCVRAISDLFRVDGEKS